METEVTRQMWADLKAVQSSLPADPTDVSYGSGMMNPVQRVTWRQTVLFANLLSKQRGLQQVYYTDSSLTAPINSSNDQTVYVNWNANGYRLPTEGEWEYFTRAGTTGPFSVNEPAYNSSTYQSCSAGSLTVLENVAWFCANSGSATHPAGSKAANPWGLKDVHGNVWEWCWDWYGSYPAAGQTDFHGSSSGSNRVLRGGGWNVNPQAARSGSRPYYNPGSSDGSIGFRLLRSADTPPSTSSTTTTAPLITTTSSTSTTTTTTSSSTTTTTSSTTTSTRVTTSSSSTLASTTTTTLGPASKASLWFEACGGARGGTIYLPLSFSSQTDISDIRFEVLFKPDILTFTDIELEAQTQLEGKEVEKKELSAGRWSIAIGSSANKRIIGNGIIASLKFQVAATAPFGSTPILINKAQGLPPSGPAYAMPDVQQDMKVLRLPVLDHISPTSGSAGTLLVLVGSNFSSCLSSIYVHFNRPDGKSSVRPKVVTSTRIEVIVPNEAREGETLTVSLSVADVPAESTFPFRIDSSRPFSSLTSEVEEPTLLGGNAVPRGAVIDPRTNRAYVADNLNSRIVVIDSSNAGRITDYPIPGGSPVRLAVNPATRRLIATQSQANRVCLLGIQPDGSLQNPRQLEVGLNPLGVAVNPMTDQAVVVNNESQSVSLIDLSAERVLRTFAVGKQPTDVAIDPQRNRAYVCNSGDNSVSVIDLGLGVVEAPIPNVGSRPLSVEFHAESGTLLVGSNSGLLLGNPEQVKYVPLLAGESVDGLTTHMRRGVANIVNNSTGRLTTIDLLAAFKDESRAVIGAVSLKNLSVKGLALNSLTNEGLLTVTSAGSSGFAEQSADGAGVSRLTMPSSLNFPRLLVNAATDVFAVAVSNPTGNPATLQMTAMDGNGRLLPNGRISNPVTKVLPIGGQISKLETDGDMFGSSIRGSGDLWYKLVAPNPGLKAFFMTADPEFKNSLVGVEETGTLLSEAVLPAVRPNSQILLCLINPLGMQLNPKLRLISDSGLLIEEVSRTLPPHGLLQKNLGEIFTTGVGRIGSGAYIRILGASGVRGYQLLLPDGRRDPAGFNAQGVTARSPVLNFSYFVSGRDSSAGMDYETRAGIINLESTEQAVTLSIRGADGKELAAPQTIRIAGNGRAEPEVRSLFQLPTNVLTQALYPTGSGWPC